MLDLLAFKKKIMIQIKSVVGITPINNQTGTSYTLTVADTGKLVRMSNAAAITLTIPTNTVSAFKIWTQIDISQAWVWAITVWWAWVTINSLDWKLTSNWQFSGYTLIKVAINTWDLYWNLA